MNLRVNLNWDINGFQYLKITTNSFKITPPPEYKNSLYNPVYLSLCMYIWYMIYDLKLIVYVFLFFFSSKISAFLFWIPFQSNFNLRMFSHIYCSRKYLEKPIIFLGISLCRKLSKYIKNLLSEIYKLFWWTLEWFG